MGKGKEEGERGGGQKRKWGGKGKAGCGRGKRKEEGKRGGNGEGKVDWKIGRERDWKKEEKG